MEGRNHNRALFIPTEIKEKRTSYVMVDDGSTINVFPLQILPNLGVKVEELTKSDLVIRAYNDSTRSVEGTFVAPMKAGPIEAVIEFTMLDIPITYALLLGRPWYHVLGGVPSTVYQKVKFLLDGEVITIDASMSKTVSAVRDEQKHVVTPPDFQIARISAGIERDPRVSSMMKKMNYRPEQGLGKNEQGNPELLDFKSQDNMKGLGYKGVGLSKIERSRFFSRNNLLRNVGLLKDSFVKEGKGKFYLGEEESV